jgi:Protein of unknown function (DUF3592)
MSLWHRQNSRLVGAIFTFVGLPSLGVGLWMGHIQSTIIKTWPTVDAEVIKSQVNAVQHTRTTRTGLSVTYYEAEIVFRYIVGGKEYTARSTPGYITSRYRDMKRIADTYAPGTRHPIRYNPEYPNIIFFNAGYNFAFFLLPLMFGGMGLLFTCIGVITLKVAPAASAGPGRPCQACGQALQPGQEFCSNCGRPVPAG